ncbi:MAG TPA: DUF4142 domain-containing protein [Puia sp.]|nr:DUF4142 domain-containing protein [Puia sp.]
MGNHPYNAQTPRGFIDEKAFRTDVMPRMQRSKLVCEIVLEKTTDADIKEFAGLEQRGAATLIDILQDLGTPQIALDGETTAFLVKLKHIHGVAFDKEYMAATLSDHEFLLKLAQRYLDNPAGKPPGRDKETWHMAALALLVFTEHLALCRKIIAAQETP